MQLGKMSLITFLKARYLIKRKIRKENEQFRVINSNRGLSNWGYFAAKAVCSETTSEKIKTGVYRVTC